MDPLFSYEALSVSMPILLGLANHFRRLTSLVTSKSHGILEGGDGDSGMAEGLDFNHRMSSLIGEVVSTVGEFQHFDARRIRISASFNRSRTRGGVLAYVVPLRYRDGLPVELRRHGNRMYHWAMLPLNHDGHDILYYMYFMLPRFLSLPWREKIETVIHELYHVHPSFNGDLRRFKGRSKLHGCHKAFDKKVRELTDEFLSAAHDTETYDFLRGGPYHLRLRYGEIRAHHLAEPKPKLLKVTAIETVSETIQTRFPSEELPEPAW
jgi:hypothetical protein